MPLCCCCHETEVDTLLKVCGHMVCSVCCEALLQAGTPGTRTTRVAPCPICRKGFNMSDTIKMYFN
jgi:hypothetical protein